jgi:short-chain Z-isoprenyl diphosphate synthase
MLSWCETVGVGHVTVFLCSTENLHLLPDSTAHALKHAVEATKDCATGNHITLAIGYGGRQRRPGA